jgi:uncharacterized protein (DUF885 family)
MANETHDHRAAAGVRDPALVSLLEEHWEDRMRRLPVWASRLGDRRLDGRLPGTGLADHETDRASVALFLARARKVDPETLDADDRLTHALLVDQLETGGVVAACRLEEWSLSPRHNPVTTLGWLPEVRPVETPEDAASLFARYRAFPALVAGDLECLRKGASEGRFANAESTRRTAELARAETAKASAEWAAVTQVPEAFRAEAGEIVDAVLRPALAEYADVLASEILPHARDGDRVGLSSLPGGEDAYAALIRQFTTLPLTAAEIHETGLAELESIHEEFTRLGERTFRSVSVEATFERLRTDPDLFFATSEEVEAKAKSALDAARDAMPDWFGRLPRADCVVKRVPDHEAPYTTVAYYRPGTPDGAQPGEYRINTYAPETRPRHEAEVLAFHEAIPGHHLQISIAQELSGLPAFRRHGGWTAYVEGWALYIERRADEMGLYTGDLDRLGMLSFDAWRASRLVVDTGIHTMGWSREKAIAFMESWTPLARNNIDNEVDRYVSWPGQALSYKIGQIEMWRLRREAEAAAGDAFDVKRFHDAVLTAGALPLRVLAARLTGT